MCRTAFRLNAVRTDSDLPYRKKSFLPRLAGSRLIRFLLVQSASGLILTESGSYRVTQDHIATAWQALSYYHFIIRHDAASIATCSEEAEKTERAFTTDQKRWLKDLRDKDPGLKHLWLAQEIQDRFGGNFLSRSTVTDWLKPNAIKRVYTPDTYNQKRRDLETIPSSSMYQLHKPTMTGGSSPWKTLIDYLEKDDMTPTKAAKACENFYR